MVHKKAYSLIELIIVVLCIGILAAVAVPRLNFAAISKHKAETTARKIVIDIRRARRLSISNAATNTDGFKLNMDGQAPYSSYRIENSDTEEVIDSHTIDSAVTCTGGKKFIFGPLGNLKSKSDTQLVVSAEGRTFTITATRATGMIKCTKN